MEGSTTETVQCSSEDIIKVLVATDIHLGHLENDPVRGDDSFIAFEEVLATAAECEVDMILLGGDLFDHAKPSPGCMLRATALIRQYCLGDKPIQLELLSDPIEGFGRQVNYQDPNLNISYPIFSIHGNHDDPVGQGSVSSLDILSSMGLVNYFGRWNDYSHVSVAPVLMRKGQTQLALYGLSHLKDQRLARLFKEGKVEMQRPPGEEWFNLLVLHQNRADRGPGNYIQEEVLPDFLDLVVWGHEHDCRVHEEQNQTRKFFVTQPGSTVATSLAAGEALPKHVAMLQLHRNKFILTPIPLKTVRPFVFQTIVLSEEPELQAGAGAGGGEAEALNEQEKVQRLLSARVAAAAAEAAQRRSGDPRQPALPLVRLSVLYERDAQDFNRVRFGQNFDGMIANPHDVLLMKREKRIRERKQREEEGGQEEEGGGLAAGAAAAAADVEALLQEYFSALPESRRPALLSPRALTDAVRDFTCKKDHEAFQTALRAQRRRALDKLLASTAESEEEVRLLLRDCRLELDEAEPARRRDLLRAGTRPERSEPSVVLTRTVVLSSDEEPLTPAPVPAGRGRGRGRGRGARGARGRGSPAAPPAPHSPPPERRTTPRRSAAKKTTSWLKDVIADRANVIDDDSD